jgi:translation initiation factor 2 beta subunit (eIF-2beta)/eIF-5
MNRRERRWTEKNQEKLIKKIQRDTLKQLNKDYPTDEDKKAYIEKLKKELEMNIEPETPFDVITFKN